MWGRQDLPAPAIGDCGGGGGRRNPGAGAPLSARAAPADGPARVNGFPAATSGSPVRGSCLSLEVPAESPPFPPATPQAHAHALPSTSGGGHGDGGGQVGPGVSHRPLPPFSPGRRGPFPAGRQPLFWDPAVLPGPAHLRPPPAGLPLWSAGRCGSLAG